MLTAPEQITYILNSKWLKLNLWYFLLPPTHTKKILFSANTMISIPVQARNWGSCYDIFLTPLYSNNCWVLSIPFNISWRHMLLFIPINDMFKHYKISLDYCYIWYLGFQTRLEQYFLPYCIQISFLKNKISIVFLIFKSLE